MSAIAFDLTVNLPAVISLGVLTGGGIAAWVTVRLQVAANKAALADQKADHAEDVADLKASIAAANALIKANAERIEDVRAKGAKELADYKLEAAQRYATSDLLKEVEERMIEAINRLGDRFDRYFDGVPVSKRRTPSRQG